MFLQAGLVDEGMREDLLTIESSMKQYCAQEQWRQAWNVCVDLDVCMTRANQSL